MLIEYLTSVGPCDIHTKNQPFKTFYLSKSIVPGVSSFRVGIFTYSEKLYEIEESLLPGLCGSSIRSAIGYHRLGEDL